MRIPATTLLCRFLFAATALTASSAAPVKLVGPVTYGSPDQPYGRRRPVTAADRAAIAAFRSARRPPVFSTKFATPAELQAGWNLLTDDGAGLKSCRRPGNVEASGAGLTLKTLAASDCKSARWSTGTINSKATYAYGFFEATMRIADIHGMNNSLWLTTEDHYEIDVAEAQYPDYIHIGLQYWPASKEEQHTGIGFGAHFSGNLSEGFHDIGLLWTPNEMIFEVDGEPVAAAVTGGAVKGAATIRLSSALADWAGGVPSRPEGHDMMVNSLRVFSLQDAPAAGAVVTAPPPKVPVEVGIDRSLLSGQDPATRQRMLEDIHALHATWFRDGPTSGSARGVANFVDEVARAKRLDLKVLANILQMGEDYDVPLVTHDHGWKAKKLSQINLDKFARRFRNLLGALKAANLAVDAVEFGNEDDSFYYDADVPNGHPATPDELHTWLRGYGEFLKTGATILHDPAYFPQAKIVTFGIAHGSDQYDNPPHHLSNPAKAVAMLRDVDGFNYLDNAGYHVDAFGTHIYASPKSPGDTATVLLRQDIWALGRDRPFWITEWGFTDATKFPNRKGQTISQGLTELLDAFDELAQRVPIGPRFFYSYDSGLADASGKASGLVDTSGHFVPAASVLASYALSKQAVR